LANDAVWRRQQGSICDRGLGRSVVHPATHCKTRSAPALAKLLGSRAARQRDFDQLRRTADDPVSHRAYVRKASLLESVKKRAAVDAA